MYRVDALPAVLATDILASTCFWCVSSATSHVVGFAYHEVFASSIESAGLLWTHGGS